MNIFEKIAYWSKQCNLPVSDNKQFPTEDRVKLSLDLIKEEVGELEEAISKKDLKEVQDALGDILWLAVRGMQEFGIDPNTTMEAIYNSNMTKIDETLEDALTTQYSYQLKGIETMYIKNSSGKYLTFNKNTQKLLKSYRFKEPKF